MKVASSNIEEKTWELKEELFLWEKKIVYREILN